MVVGEAFYAGASRADISTQAVLALNARMHRVRNPFLYVAVPTAPAGPESGLDLSDKYRTAG
jgi:hypothetical protein